MTDVNASAMIFDNVKMPRTEMRVNVKAFDQKEIVL